MTAHDLRELFKKYKGWTLASTGERKDTVFDNAADGYTETVTSKCVLAFKNPESGESAGVEISLAAEPEGNRLVAFREVAAGPKPAGEPIAFPW